MEISNIRASIATLQFKPVAFAIRTNVEYDSEKSRDCPVADRTLSFNAGEFVHIKEVRVLSF